MFERVKRTSKNVWLSLQDKPLIESLANQKNFATRRFGQKYTILDLKTESARNPYFNFLTEGIYDKTFANGFEICDSEVGETDNRVDTLSDELTKQRVNKALITVAKMDAKYGSCSTVMFESINRFEETFTEIKSFWPEAVRFEFHENTALGDLIKQVQVEEKLPGKTSRVTTIPDSTDEFKNYFFIRTRPSDDYPNVGISELDPVWDIGLFANVILEAAMVAGVRVAFGIREATVYDRKDPAKNAAVLAAMEGGLKALESGDSSIIMKGFMDEATSQLVKDEFKVHTGEIHFPYDAMIDMAHKVLSMKTGIPKNYFDGIFQGSLVGAEVVDEQLETAKQERRKWYQEVFTDIIHRWCELNGFDWKDSYYIHWLQEEILTEREQAEIDNMKAQKATALVAGYIISEEEARDDLGYEGPPPKKPDLMNLGTINVRNNNQTTEEKDEEETMQGTDVPQQPVPTTT